MIRAAIFSSFLRHDLEAALSGGPVWTAACLFSNRPGPHVEAAKKKGVPAFLFEGPHDQFEEWALKSLKLSECRLAVCVGFNKLLSRKFIDAAPPVINAHPSLLPAFPGPDNEVYPAVLARGCKLTGVTFHFVDEGIDTGQIIHQSPVPVLERDGVESLRERVEAKLAEEFPKALAIVAQAL
ncbi:hypothetical protein HYS54_04200 [Candidatus Micrarchaeota archaeon]|nr:hypothetical protein [Candidatus Micrarchaeota archaeon]